MRTVVVLVVALASCTEEAVAPPPVPIPIPRPAADAGPARNEQAPPDDRFIAILEMGGGPQHVVAVSIEGDAQAARARCFTMPGKSPQFREWKRVGTLGPGRIAALWEQIERTEWEVLKNEGAVREAGSASLTIRRGNRDRAFLAQANCACEATPRPACCAGASAIKGMLEVCRDEALNAPPSGSFNVQLQLLKTTATVLIRGDETGATLWREHTEANAMRVFQGGLGPQQVSTLWAALEAERWPAQHELPEPVREKTDAFELNLERGGVRTSFAISDEPLGDQRKLVKAIEEVAFAKSVAEVPARTRVLTSPPRIALKQDVVQSGECKATPNGVRCHCPAYGPLDDTSCFPTNAKNVFACVEKTDSTEAALVLSSTPVTIPAEPSPWRLVLDDGSECGAPPATCTNRIQISRLVKGSGGYFAVRADGEPPMPVKTYYSHAYVPTRR